MRIAIAAGAVAGMSVVYGWAAAGPGADFDPARLHRTALWGDASLRHAGTVTCIVPLPDGKRLLSAARDGTARLWSLDTGAEIRRYPMPEKGGDVWSLALLPGGKSFLSASADGRIREWDLETGATNRVFDQGVQVFRLAVAPDGRSFVAGDSADAIVQWNLADGTEIRRFLGHKEDVYAVAFADGGKKLVSGSSDKTAKIWDFASGECLRTLKSPANVGSVVPSPDGTKVVLLCGDKGIECHPVNAEGVAWMGDGGEGAYMASWSQDGKEVFLPSGTGIHVLDGATGEARRRFDGLKRARWACALAPDGKTFYAATANAIRRYDPGTLKDLGPGREPSEDLGGHDSAAFLPAVSNVVWKEDEFVWRFDVRTGTTTNWTTPIPKVDTMAASADGTRLAFAGDDLVVVNTDGGKGTARLAESATAFGKAQSLVFDPAGKRLLVGRANGTVTVHDAANLAQRQSLAVRNPEPATPDGFSMESYESVDRLAIGGDGRFAAATTSGENYLAVWDLADGQRVESLKLGSPSDVEALAFLGSDGRTLLGAIESRVIAWPSAESKAGRADAAVVKKLLEQMGADDFATRETATRKLVELGEPALLLAEKMPSGDPEVAERLKSVRAKIGRDKAADPEPVAIDLGGDCSALWTVPGGPYWIAIAGEGGNAALIVGEYRDGALSIVRRIEDGHGPAAILNGPTPRSFVTSNNDGTFSVYEW